MIFFCRALNHSPPPGLSSSSAIKFYQTTLSELIFTFKSGEDTPQSRGTQERQNKESRPSEKGVKWEGPQRVPGEEEGGERGGRGRECGPSYCARCLCKAETRSSGIRNGPLPNHMAMSILDVVLTPVIIY